MRNGDYSPTRLDAQQDAGTNLKLPVCIGFKALVFSVNLLFTTRMDSHPENTVGLLSMAGKGYAIFIHMNNMIQLFHLIMQGGYASVSD